MTQYAFSAHTYPNNPDRWLKPPVGKYLEIIKAALEPHKGVRQIDLCCGLGFGKTLLAIQIAVLKMDRYPGSRILFLEPDWDRVEDIFWDVWEEHVPPELYRRQVGKNKLTWLPNGSMLRAKARVITGSKEQSKDKRRGPGYTDVIDDETAIGFDRETYANTIARIREPSPCKCYITLTTPKVGEYGRFLKRGGNIIFRGRTADNHYLLKRQPDYEINLRRVMSPEQARRELDGELVALEGRIWKTAKYQPHDPDDPEDDQYSWPKGNRHDQFTSFRNGEPYWLAIDIGSATGSYVILQQTDSRGLYDDDCVWVAVADLCPREDASASRAFQSIKKHFGIPVAVTGGADINTLSSTDGRTVAYFVENIFGPHVHIFPCNERIYNAHLRYDKLSFLFCSATGERRLTIARDFISLDLDSKRGIREMVDEDQWPTEDKRRVQDFLPKGKDNVVQHTRDALQMFATMIGAPPDWLYDRNPAA